MSDYQTFIADRLTEVDYQDSRTEPFIRDATVRQLRELSRNPVDFLDGEYSWSTIADQDNYGTDHPNFPADVYSWTGRPYVASSTSPLVVRNFIDGPVSISEVREASSVNTLTAQDPWIFAWHNEHFWLAPRPAGIFTIQGDYRRDGRRDSTTGALITTTSTTHTNGWFDDGENVLRCAVLLEYASTITKDEKTIRLLRDQLYGVEGRPGLLSNIVNRRKAKRTGLVQSADTMFSTAGVGVNRKSAWRWQ